MQFWIWYMVHAIMDLSLGRVQWYNRWRGSWSENRSLWRRKTIIERQKRSCWSRKFHFDLASIRKYKEAPRTRVLLDRCRAIPVINPWVAESQSLRLRYPLAFFLHKMPLENLGIIETIQRIQSTILQVVNIQASHRTRISWVATGGLGKGKSPASTWGLEAWKFFFLSNTFNWIGQIWARFHRFG